MPSPPLARAPVAFVLVEPRGEGNVGAVARALKNNGFSDLRLVNGVALGDEARRMARGSEDVLNGARRVGSVAEAVAQARVVAGFTARDRRDLREAVDLDEGVARLAAAAREGPVALLFGREDHGLSAAELEPCSFLVTIPAAVERPVYNLAQAVLLAAYTLARALAHVAVPPVKTQFRAEPVLAASELDRLAAQLRGTLIRLGYDRHPDPGLLERIVQRARAGFQRAEVSAADRDMLLGVLRQVERRLPPNGAPEP